MRALARHLRTVLINLLVLFVLLATLALGPPALLDLSDLLRAKPAVQPDPALLASAQLPNYRDLAWAERHFAELAVVATTYHDFIGWRRKPFSGETVTVDRDGYRQHAPDRAASFLDAEIWVFGGSGIWGSGVRDELTIPARLEALTGAKTFNFGELGYTAHQSLNLLMKSYVAGGRPKHVIFYDGVNEVLSKCRREHDFYSSLTEGQLRSRLEQTERPGSRLLEVFGPTLRAAGKLFGRGAAGHGRAMEGGALYDCHLDAEKTRALARALALDWAAAAQLVEAHGGRFHAALQPVAFLGAPNLAHIPSVREEALLARQYEVAYPVIRAELEARRLPHQDLGPVHDGEAFLYFDFCHVSPEGNERVAAALAERLRGDQPGSAPPEPPPGN